jgi:hypothetical protein
LIGHDGMQRILSGLRWSHGRGTLGPILLDLLDRNEQ